jgi:hypothetical protein
MSNVTTADLVGLLRKMAANNHVMRLQDGTLRLLPFRTPAPWGDIVSPHVVSIAVEEDLIRTTWAPEGCCRYRLSPLGIKFLAEQREAV